MPKHLLGEIQATLTAYKLIEDALTLYGVDDSIIKPGLCSEDDEAHLCYKLDCSAKKGDLELTYGMYLDFEEAREGSCGLVFAALHDTDGNHFLELTFRSEQGWRASANKDLLNGIPDALAKISYLVSGASIKNDQAKGAINLMTQLLSHRDTDPPL